MKVLMIDDDEDLGEAIIPLLERYGITLSQSATPQAGLARLREDRPDAIVLDMMLPEMDGMEVCRLIRAAPEVYGNPPIVALSARAELTDRVVGLEAGVDDYIAKPFELRELVARLRAITRSQGRAGVPLRAAQRPDTREALVLDAKRLEALQGSIRVSLTQLELELLQALQTAGGQVLSRAALLPMIGHGPDSDPALIDTLVYRIRQRFRAAGGRPDVIVTMRGQGYALLPEGGQS